MLLHQGIGLDVFNELPMRRAVHALYECCNSVPLAADWHAAARMPITTRCSGRRTRCCSASERAPSTQSCRPTLISAGAPAARSRSPSNAPCGLINPQVMEQLGAALKRYLEHFGFGFVMYINGNTAQDILTTMSDRFTTTARPSARWFATSWPGSTAPGWSACWDPRAATTTGEPRIFAGSPNRRAARRI